MSTLTAFEQTQLEELLEMAGGFVLDFTNSSFSAFIRNSVGVDIYADKYELSGDSKAKRFRAFWALESDNVVGKALQELLEYWSFKNRQPNADKRALADDCRRIVGRLLGEQELAGTSEEQFVSKDFGRVSLKDVNIDASLLPILQSRYTEATRCLKGDAPLATIFLCGSILEGLLLGLASTEPREFNEARSSPKNANGKVRPFHEWSLAQFIDVASELGYLKLDVQKFGHGLRDFRNYIHPYEQMASGFNPDKHTAEICMQVLRAAIACLSGERS
jgi:hypothetical protein